MFILNVKFMSYIDIFTKINIFKLNLKLYTLS